MFKKAFIIIMALLTLTVSPAYAIESDFDFYGVDGSQTVQTDASGLAKMDVYVLVAPIEISATVSLLNYIAKADDVQAIPQLKLVNNTGAPLGFTLTKIEATNGTEIEKVGVKDGNRTTWYNGAEGILMAEIAPWSEKNVELDVIHMGNSTDGKVIQYSVVVDINLIEGNLE